MTSTFHVLDANGLIASWGAGTQPAVRHGMAEPCNAPMSSLYTETEIAENLPQNLLERARAQGRAAALRLREEGGHEVRARIAVEALYDPTGTLTGFSHAVEQTAAPTPSEMQFRAAMAHSAIGLARTAPDGRFLEVNIAAAAIMGYSVDELLTLRYQDITHPDDLELSATKTIAVTTGQMPSNQFEKRYIRKDGTFVWALLTISPVSGPDGDTAYFITHVQDITAQKTADAARAVLLERLTLAIDVGQLGIWEADLVTGNRYWDRSTITQYGLDPDKMESIGFTEWLACVHPEDRDRVKAASQMVLEGHTRFETVYRVVWPNGEIHYIRSLSNLLRDDAGTPLRVVGINMDITDSKAAEAELTRLTERIKLAMHAGQLGVWEINAQTGAMYWDEGTVRQYGRDPAILLRSEDWMTSVHPGDRERVGRAMQETIASDLPMSTEYRVIWPDGSTHTLRALSIAVRDDAGNPLRMVGISQDVTEARTMALNLEAEKQRLIQTLDQLMVAKQEAEQANRAKSEFLMVMSHELRTPMNAVLGFGQLLTDDRFGPLNPKQLDFVETILQSGGHLLGLIDEILELSRIESGKVDISIEPVALAAVLKSVIATLTPAAEKHRIRLDATDFDDDAPTISTDRVRLTQALINLGSNAVKYNRPDGVVTFTHAQTQDGWLRIMVADTGIGIPEDRQNELFQPFNRLGAAQLGIEGTGVGLALTRRLIHLVGGRVDFTSTSGRGSQFWIDLPFDTETN